MEWVLLYLAVGSAALLLDMGYQWLTWRRVSSFPGGLKNAVLIKLLWPAFAAVVVFRVAKSMDSHLEIRKRSH